MEKNMENNMEKDIEKGIKKKKAKKPKSKRKFMNKDIEEIVESNEPIDIYTKAVVLFDKMPCMTLTNSKIEMYKDLKNQFLNLGDFQDAAIYAKRCEELENETRKAVIEFEYKQNGEKLAYAKTRNDFEELKDSYHNMNGYLDSKKMEQQCTKAIKNLDKKYVFAKARWIAGILLIIVLIGLSHTNYGRYTIARGFHKVTLYENSAKMYKGLGSYKDSKDRYHESVYRQAMRELKKEKLEEASTLFYKISDYRDSSEQLLAIDNQILNATQVGETVTIGKFLWFVLDKQDGKVLLMKNAPIKNITYHDNEADVTWETSAIRNYLNDTFLHEYFCEAEISNIPMIQNTNADNEKYGTIGGNATEDQIFILSKDELKQYENVILEKGKKNFWVRTPGGLSCAATTFEKSECNDYGEIVNEQNISAYPVFWYAVQ